MFIEFVRFSYDEKIIWESIFVIMVVYGVIKVVLEWVRLDKVFGLLLGCLVVLVFYVEGGLVVLEWFKDELDVMFVVLVVDIV